ncbi:MAG: hypothetical protein U9Q82_03330, partial [Chloroflexota bacterium]|nr:hypothetical protein [Chloroflexota bacterium]
MVKKVIYSGCTEPFWLDVAERLLTEFEWQPRYWIGRFDIENDVVDQFPNVIFQSSIDAVKGILPLEYSEINLLPLDKPLLESLAKCEVTTLRMMDRMDALGSFDYHARVRHYHRLLQYWSTVLDDVQPDIVFFKEIP